MRIQNVKGKISLLITVLLKASGSFIYNNTVFWNGKEAF